MELEYDFVEATFLNIDGDGNLIVPPSVLRTLNVKPGDKMIVITANECVIIEPKNKPPVSYRDLAKKYKNNK